MALGNGTLGANINGGVDVFVQDQTSPLFQYFLIREQKTDITLTSPISQDDTVINVSSGHGFTGRAGTPGEYITIFENNRYFQQQVVSVSTDALTLEYPVDTDYTVAGASVIRGNNLLNVNGSVTPVNFDMTIRDFTIPIDISGIILTMFHTATADDGKFGGIAELTNGVWFRKGDGFDFNLGNYRNNQDFKNVGGVPEYTAKGPAGSNATSVTFDLKRIFGQVIRMDARDADTFCAQVRDNLTGLDSFIFSLIGSYTEGE